MKPRVIDGPHKTRRRVELDGEVVGIVRSTRHGFGGSSWHFISHDPKFQNKSGSTLNDVLNHLTENQ